MPSIFTKIINREIPAEIVWEDNEHIAILDIRPLNPGHLLLIPKKEIAYIFEMADADYQKLFATAKFLAKPLKEATGAKRIGLSVEGFGVDHIHVHLIPINQINEIDPNRAKQASPEELKIMAEKIRQKLV